MKLLFEFFFFSLHRVCLLQHYVVFICAIKVYINTLAKHMIIPHVVDKL